MILTENEMQQIRRSIEAQAGLDEELMRRCGDLVHIGKFDEAVRSAFVLLEERLREAIKKEGTTGTNLANYAFNPADGPLAKLLGQTQSEREGLRELYSGAFKLFRNPTAHGVVDYSADQGKAIISLVNLLLIILKRAEGFPSPDLFPDNLETALGEMESAIGPGATSRLRVFLGKCMKKMGLKPSPSAKQWIPFKGYAFGRFGDWKEPKPHPIAVFYIFVSGEGQYKVQFPVQYYYKKVIGFNVDQLIDELKGIGFQAIGSNREPTIDLQMRNDQAFFDELLNLIARIVDELEGTLPQK